jgi:hypothetical protein
VRLQAWLKGVSMGGSGGGGYTPGPDAEPEIDCARLRFTTYLTSLIPEVLNTVSEREIADVVLVGGLSFEVIEVWTRRDGELIGAIVERWADLRHCLSIGVRFVAEFLSVTSPVQVEVRPRPVIDCAVLVARTRLHLSDGVPAPMVGTTFPLTLDIRRRPGEQVRVTHAISGADIGSVRCHPVDLPDCLGAGHQFQVRVESVSGEHVFVHVDRASEAR